LYSTTVNALLLAVLVLAPSITVAQSPTETAPDNPPESLDACTLIDNSIERLACYDDFAAPAKTWEYEQAAEAEASAEEADSEGSVNEDEDSGVTSRLLGRYVEAEKAIFSFSGSFVGHRPMYILPASYFRGANRTPSSPRLGDTGYDYNIDNQEAKYQISFKVPLLTGWLDDRTTLWFGYTQKSFWQVYNTDDSAPFRETNYEPEVFLRYATNYDFGPGTLNGITLGFNHQSNGQPEPRSRSWNRITANLAYSYNRWLFMVRPWYRLPEDASEDDNEDIERYLGHADYMAIYKLSEDRTLSLTLQNNLRSDNNRTSIELGYSFPLGDTIKGYVQYFNGYGESLIDYNERVQRIGIGIMLNDWL